MVNNWYRGGLKEAVTVALFQPNFITGGGYLVAANSAGVIAALGGTNINYGFNVKYNKKGTTPQGNVNIIVRANCLPVTIDPLSPGTGTCLYQIKSTAIDSLSANPTANPPTAQFNSKANIQDVTDPGNAHGVNGNMILKLTMTDKGEPGANVDTLGIQLYNSVNQLWFSSYWFNLKTTEQAIKGGNLSVH
jgi:hypothetical protein